MSTHIMPSTGLANDAHERLVARFSEVGHRPSLEQWDAIRDLLDHLERAANGTLDRAMHLFPIPPGTGKSQSLIAFAMTLMGYPSYDGVGMLVTVSRITEARDMAEELGLYKDRLCVITSDAKVNALGAHTEAMNAQVCICTQAALKLELKACGVDAFDFVTRFQYRFQRRAIVCWDESFAFNRPATLDATSILGLAKAMERQSPAAVTALLDWSSALRKGAEDGPCDIPDFVELGVDFQRLEDDVGYSDDMVVQVKALSTMSGGKGFATRGDFNATTLITHYPELSPSLMPLIVTDASAAVNPSYDMMKEANHPINRRDGATKTYGNMTIRIVPTAASRSVYRDVTQNSLRARELVDMAVRYIREVTPDPVLVIGYKSRLIKKGRENLTIQEAIEDKLTAAEKERVHHLTWGKHTATNDFKTVRHVLLMGLNYMPRPVGQATAGAALDMNLLVEQPTADQIEKTRLGMLKDATLQAVLRGNARMGVDGDCGEMEVVIPQVKQSGLSEEDYGDMFPGVAIRQDRVLMPPKPLKGNLKRAADAVQTMFSGGAKEVAYPDVYRSIDMTQGNFSALVKKPEWKTWLANAGYYQAKLWGGAIGLRLA